MKALLIGLCCVLLSLSVRTNGRSVRRFNPDSKLVLITLDGLRWQEVFAGADSALLHNAAYTANIANARQRFWAATATARRQLLFPFLWQVLAANGQLLGNRWVGNRMNVANPYALSYPGYNELLTGAVDLSIFNNGKAYNSNSNFLDELNLLPPYRNRVAVFASWDAFPFILNRQRSRVYINSGFDPLPLPPSPESVSLANTLQAGSNDHPNTRNDALTFLACKTYIEKKSPSVVMLSLGGTDEAAHQKNYGAYLQQAQLADRLIGELWRWLQTQPAYQGKTSLVITTDHGRGAAAGNWHTHGLLVGGSSQTWMAMMGPAVSKGVEQHGGAQLYTKDVKGIVYDLLSQPTSPTALQADR